MFMCNSPWAPRSRDPPVRPRAPQAPDVEINTGGKILNNLLVNIQNIERLKMDDITAPKSKASPLPPGGWLQYMS